ncbi:hypothetical protein CK203_114828 [Vitis vinifera]|uniref:Uncharacterized protein n=1 Tax=Vitis vinifera TaxID=29760 RepID=A0A438FEN7_VITVI|nr:hypothetical protein CK203_114828 [Vitis vinifera]
MALFSTTPRNAQENWKNESHITRFERQPTPCFPISFSHFPEKISRRFQEKALPPYGFQPQAVIRDVSSGDDPPDLGIPPNRGLCPSGETLTLNLTSRSFWPSTQWPAAGDSGGPSSPRRSTWDS